MRVRNSGRESEKETLSPEEKTLSPEREREAVGVESYVKTFCKVKVLTRAERNSERQ